MIEILLAVHLAALAAGAADATIAVPMQPEAAEAEAPPSLPTGWRWELEPVSPAQNWATDGWSRVTPAGVLTVWPLDDGLAVQLVQAPTAAVGSAKPKFEVWAVDESGQRLDSRRWHSQSNREWEVQTAYFRGTEPAALERVGIAMIDLEGRRARAAEAAERARAAGAEALPLPVVGEPYRFELTDLAGNRIRSEDLLGKVVLIDCWATWCGPCMAKMPELTKVREAFSEDDLVVIGINFDQEATRERAERAIAEQALDWPHVSAAESAQGYEGDLWEDLTGITSIPRLLLIDREGVLRADFYPFELEKRVRELVEEGEGA